MTEKGAIYPGTNWGVYCDPDGIKDGSKDNWELYPVDELEDAGYSRCEMCYGENDD